MNGPPGVDVMLCEGCGQVTPWTPYGRCSWECYNLPRATPEEQQAAMEAAPRVQAYFQALQAAAEAQAMKDQAGNDQAGNDEARDEWPDQA